MQVEVCAAVVTRLQMQVAGVALLPTSCKQPAASIQSPSHLVASVQEGIDHSKQSLLWLWHELRPNVLQHGLQRDCQHLMLVAEDIHHFLAKFESSSLKQAGGFNWRKNEAGSAERLSNRAQELPILDAASRSDASSCMRCIL